MSLKSIKDYHMAIATSEEMLELIKEIKSRLYDEGRSADNVKKVISPLRLKYLDILEKIMEYEQNIQF